MSTHATDILRDGIFYEERVLRIVLDDPGIGMISCRMRSRDLTSTFLLTGFRDQVTNLNRSYNEYARDRNTT